MRFRFAEVPASKFGSELLLDEANFGIALIRRDGVILEISGSVLRMLGYQPRAACGKNLFHYVHPADVELCRAAIEAIEAGSNVQQLSYRIMHVSGRWRVHEATLRGSENTRHGHPFLVNFLDVTDHERAFARAGTRERELEHMMRLHSMGELAAAMSHELMQPFAAITNFIGGSIARLERGNGQPDEILGALHAANAEARRAGQIMSRLRTFISRHEPTVTVIDVCEVITSAIEFMKMKAERAECRVEVHGTANGPFLVKGDSVLLGQVILNIAFNGIEAMSDTAPGERLLVIAVDRLPTAVRISIEDRGCGLPAVSPDRLFESFFTTKPDGSGIGLSLCRTIVEAYDGHLWVSRRPVGSRFHLSMPPLEDVGSC